MVVVPSIRDRLEPWDELVSRLKSLPGFDDQNCHWHRTRHGASWYKPGRAEDYGVQLAADIHEQWVAAGGYRDVVLVGHSLGGVLVRYAYLHGLGPFARADRREWADAVRRVVLFAALNRGVEVSARRAWWLPTAAWCGRSFPVTRRWLAHDLLRGSAFIVNLRIAWMRTLDTMERPPLVVQYLGKADRLVSEDDSRDIDSFPTGSQQSIPSATHGDLIQLSSAADPQARFALISKAFTDPLPGAVEPRGDASQRVVIVLHGIRATNDDWPRRLEEIIESGWPGTEVIVPTYGRFSALQFMLPATRQRDLNCMPDRYAERLAVNPAATFHFIGHSNGTYKMGHSLEAIPAMRFERIALAGSVLPTTYDWLARVNREQVAGVRNDRARRDVPVGILCSALRGLRMRDIGTAGVDGFQWEDPAKTEVYYFDGGHGAALSEDNLQRLASYVMEGAVDKPEGLPVEQKPSFALLSRLAPVLARLLIVVAVAVAGAAIYFQPEAAAVSIAVIAGVLLVAYLILDVI